jgi:hypothetical protein
LSQQALPILGGFAAEHLLAGRFHDRRTDCLSDERKVSWAAVPFAGQKPTSKGSAVKEDQGQRSRLFAVTVAIPLVLAIMGCVAGCTSTSPATSPNSAEITAKPIARSLTSVGGKEICDNGDGGHSGLNNQPWYKVYYLVPDESRARATFLKAAASAGFELHREKLYPGAADPYGIGSSSSGDHGLYLSINQHQSFFPGDCGTNPDKKLILSGSQAVFEITFYGKQIKG